ncbi:MAG: hypothetical protein H0X26_01825 [Alphaproteobacteria bacterium]|nr:hypothetical protein [Alphaproteobacteria bacterium]
MRQQKDHISRKNASNGAFGTYFLLVFLFSCLSAEKAFSDNTFIINFVVSDGKISGGPVTNQTAEESSKTIEKTIVLPAQMEAAQVTVNQPQASAPRQPETPQASAPQPSTLRQPATLQASAPKHPEAPKKTSVANVAVKANPKILSSAEKLKPTSLVPLQAHPKAMPVPEDNQASSLPKEQTPQRKIVSYSDAANDSSPLGLLAPDQAVHSQRWYLYSAATRGLRDFPDRIHVVSMEGKNPNRGEEVKNLLVKMGIEPAKVKLIHAAGDENQAGIIYIFAGG